ncbi:hypothetical protein NL676_006295 [Syzygium grande]|nr:hypothetical protein NL676_006295 [Syzygium grande]
MKRHKKLSRSMLRELWKIQLNKNLSKLLKDTDLSDAPAQTQESKSSPTANKVDDRQDFEEIPETTTVGADIQGELHKDKRVQIEQPDFEDFQG